MKSKLLTLTGFLVVLAIVAAIVVPYFEPENLARHEAELRIRIDTHPYLALAIGLVTYFALSLVPGTTGKSIIYGWLFGFTLGVGLSMCGLLSAGLTVFLVIRFVFRDAVQARLGARLRLWEKWLDQEGAWFLLTLRMAHVPYTLVNYLSAASRVRTWTFAWTTLVGMLPSTMIFVWMGSRLPTLRDLIDHGPQEFLDPWLWAGLLATAFLPLGVRWGIRYFRRGRHTEGVSEAETIDLLETGGTPSEPVSLDEFGAEHDNGSEAGSDRNSNARLR